MTRIARLRNRYRLAGGVAERSHMVRRLDRIATDALPQMIESAFGELADEDGPVYRIRRLKLSLWINTASMSDTQIAQSWSRVLTRAVWRAIAEAGPEQVMRYPNRGAYLAAYLSDLVGGRATDRWEYQEFKTLEGVRPGRAAAFAIAESSSWIAGVFQALAGARRLDAVIAALRASDVLVIWEAWTGEPPKVDKVAPAVLATRVRSLNIHPPPPEVASADGRARAALRWLIALATGPASLPVQSVHRLALQLAHVSALSLSHPDFATILSEVHNRGRPHFELSRILEQLSPDLREAASWIAPAIRTPAGRQALLDLLSIAVPESEIAVRGSSAAAADPDRDQDRIERTLSAFAGTALLLPVMRQMDLAKNLDAAARLRLLVSPFTGAERLLAESDPGLRWLAGYPAERSFPMADAWPSEVPAATVVPERDHQTHGEIPELQVLRAVLDRFTEGLRGMSGSSVAYLTRQFLALPGRLERDSTRLHVRLHSAPLGILLKMAHRLGEQGRIPWLGQCLLDLEIADG